MAGKASAKPGGWSSKLSSWGCWSAVSLMLEVHISVLLLSAGVGSGNSVVSMGPSSPGEIQKEEVSEVNSSSLCCG